jgi:hypothetical protein
MRWWQYVDRGWVRLSIRDGQTIRWRESHATDEGWSESAEEWTRIGSKIYRWARSAGRDCDGYLVHEVNLEVDGSELSVIEPHEDFGKPFLPPGTLLPEWRRVSRYAYDEYAAMAGY